MKCLVLLILFIGSPVWAQGSAIGHKTITFNDPSRTGGFGSGGGPGRQIQTEVYYPATAAGDNTPLLAGQYPLLVFGHGFAMSWDAYLNIWESYVPQGYILVFPRTEGSLIPSPSHGDFAQDLVVVRQKMASEAANPNSFFYNALLSKAAVMGHSMGGGAAVLAAQSGVFDAYVGLAPAETTPSAITAASAVTVPALILSGSNDGVTPPNQHHWPIYNALSSTCKTFANLLGGGHCYFANPNFNCDFGESTSSTGISLTRAQQHSLTEAQTLDWLCYFLKDVGSCYITFIQQQLTGIERTSTCPSDVPAAISEATLFFEISPNPAQEQVNIRCHFPMNATIKLFDLVGNCILTQVLEQTLQVISLPKLAAGSYWIQLSATQGTAIQKIIIE
ncbi:MAG: hypothetical protein RLZZ301_1204 [Bacteroidota bacterium]